jgi:hypothetical protein
MSQHGLKCPKIEKLVRKKILKGSDDGVFPSGLLTGFFDFVYRPVF